MEAIIRAAFIYLFLMIILRIAGTRTLNEMTTFDFVLLLVIGDASQQAITSNDYSVINAVIVITTFIVMDILMAFAKNRFKTVDRIMDGTPLVLINDGKILQKMLDHTKVNIEDILEAARKDHGISTLDEIKYAIMEKDGDISIIPEQDAK